MSDLEATALAFTQALCDRDYARALQLTAASYRARTTLAELTAAFERVVPEDFGLIGPPDVVQTMTDWPDKRAGDVGWAYVSIPGDDYGEAVTVVIARDGDALAIRDVEFGRP